MNQFSENLKASCKFLQEKRRRYSSVLRRIFSALKYLLFHCLCSGVVCQLHNISISIAHQAMALSSSSSANLFDPAIAHIWTWKVAVLPWRCLLEDGVNLKRKYWHAVLSPFEKCICSGSPLLDWRCFNLRRRLHAHRFYARFCKGKDWPRHGVSVLDLRYAVLLACNQLARAPDWLNSVSMEETSKALSVCEACI